MSTVEEPKTVQADDVPKMSDKFAKLLLASIIETLDWEEKNGTYGDEGWRKCFFGPFDSTAEDLAEVENPITPSIN